MSELRRSIAILYASIDVGCQTYFCFIMCVIFGLTNVEILVEFFLHRFFAVFLIKRFCLAINDAMASSPQEGAAIDS